MDELKPCPFCGNTTAVEVLDTNVIDMVHEDDLMWRENPYFQVVCSMNECSPVPIANWKQGCGASSGFRPTMEEAITAWNRRVDDAR